MKRPVLLFVSFVVVVMLLLSACGSAATQAPFFGEGGAPATSAPATEAPAADLYSQPMDQSGAVPMSTQAMPPSDKGVMEANAANPGVGRMIVKNADMRLQVEDTDIAIDRTTQIIGDLGGYIISSRVWYQAYFEYNLKYATLTVGMPVDQFERALSRLRGLSVKVLDETASGEDVTDQFVDLQSQLTNLQATRDRIKTFLDQAKTVDEALRVNQQLSDIENQIEQIQGRMNYLQDRSAYSTITINFEPVQPEILSTPTPTPTAIPTNVWKPGETFEQSKKTVTVAYQGIIDILIWFFVVVLPILLPPALIVWGLVKLFRRKPVQPK